jgi:polyhydroxybutyrate depolymerase
MGAESGINHHGVLGPGIHEHAVVSEGVRRIYLVHAPNDYHARALHRVIVVLHGGGGSAAFATRVYGWRELSQQTGCLIVFPQAQCENPASPAAVRENPRIWNDGSTRSAVAHRNVDDIGYLSKVLDDLRSRYAVDSDRIYVTGFSNGASMTFRAGVELSDQITAIAPVSGHLCIRDSKPARPLSMLYIIGLEDPLNPFEGGPTRSPWGALRQRPRVMESILAWVRLIGASEQPQLLRDSNGVQWVRYGPGSGGTEVQLCTIAGQGHEWPGARRTLPSSISGPQTDKLNATQTIWEFFANE